MKELETQFFLKLHKKKFYKMQPKHLKPWLFIFPHFWISFFLFIKGNMILKYIVSFMETIKNTKISKYFHRSFIYFFEKSSIS